MEIIRTYIRLSSIEISGVGVVEQFPLSPRELEARNIKLGSNARYIEDLRKTGIPQGFFISEVHLFEQKNSPAHTEIAPEAVAHLATQLREEGKGRELGFWWHSHVNMGVQWSGTDDKNMMEWVYSKNLISVVMNKRGEMTWALDMYTPVRVSLDQSDLEVIILKGGEDYTEFCQNEMAKYVKEPIKQYNFYPKSIPAYNRTIDEYEEYETLSYPTREDIASYSSSKTETVGDSAEALCSLFRGDIAYASIIHASTKAPDGIQKWFTLERYHQACDELLEYLLDGGTPDTDLSTFILTARKVHLFVADTFPYSKSVDPGIKDRITSSLEKRFKGMMGGAMAMSYPPLEEILFPIAEVLLWSVLFGSVSEFARSLGTIYRGYPAEQKMKYEWADSLAYSDIVFEMDDDDPISKFTNLKGDSL
jgi:hypothetical protein